MLPGNAGPAPPALESAFLAELGLGGHAEDFVRQRFYGKLPPDPASVVLAYADYVGMHDGWGCRCANRQPSDRCHARQRFRGVSGEPAHAPVKRASP